MVGEVQVSEEHHTRLSFPWDPACATTTTRCHLSYRLSKWCVTQRHAVCLPPSVLHTQGVSPTRSRPGLLPRVLAGFHGLPASQMSCPWPPPSFPTQPPPPPPCAPVQASHLNPTDLRDGRHADTPAQPTGLPPSEAIPAGSGRDHCYPAATTVRNVEFRSQTATCSSRCSRSN